MKIKLKQLSVTIPLASLRCLYRRKRGKKIVCEIDLASLRSVNEPNTLDELITEADFEYHAGLTKGYSDADELIASLKR